MSSVATTDGYGDAASASVICLRDEYAAADGDGVAGMDIQEMPPPLGFAAGMDMEEMQMAITQLPGFDDEMGMAVQQLLMAMPPSP